MRDPAPARHGGKKVILGVIALAIALTAAVVLQAVFSDRTGIRNPAPTVRAN